MPFSDQTTCLNETMRCTFPSTISPCSCSLHTQTQPHGGHNTSMLHVHKSGFTSRLCTERQIIHLSLWGMHLHQMGTQEQTDPLSCTHHTEMQSHKSFEARTVLSQLTGPKRKGHEPQYKWTPPHPRYNRCITNSNFYINSLFISSENFNSMIQYLKNLKTFKKCTPWLQEQHTRE